MPTGLMTIELAHQVPTSPWTLLYSSRTGKLSIKPVKDGGGRYWWPSDQESLDTIRRELGTRHV